MNRQTDRQMDILHRFLQYSNSEPKKSGLHFQSYVYILLTTFGKLISHLLSLKINSRSTIWVVAGLCAINRWKMTSARSWPVINWYDQILATTQEFLFVTISVWKTSYYEPKKVTIIQSSLKVFKEVQFGCKQHSVALLVQEICQIESCYTL